MESKEQERRTEQWLDAALNQYGEAEPRMGLQGRVLASLRSAGDRAGRPTWWPAAAAAAILLVAAGAIVWPRHAEEPGRVTLSRVPKAIQTYPSMPDRAAGTVAAATVHEPGRRTHRKPAARVQEAAEPKLDQFPSPRPLSKQEELLARYAREHPQEANLIAQAQAELEKQDLLEFEKQDARRPARNSAR